MKLKDLYLSLINEGKKYNVNELEVRTLLSYFYKINDHTSFFISLNNEVEENMDLKNVFKDLCAGKPISYITNEAEFLGKKYYVNEDVLIPRVETEELVTLAIKKINEIFKDKKLSIHEVGTGSGVIVINLKQAFPDAKISASDINKKALKIAKKNIGNIDIELYEADVFPNTKEKYDVIISNPPYIKNIKDIDKSVIDYEPISALVINDENNVYKKIFSSKRFNSPCLMIFEIAPDLVEDLKILMVKHLNNCVFSFSEDINHKTRFLSILISDENFK